MNHLPSDHHQRFILANEVHARPPEALDTPERATYVAVIVDPDDREREHNHLAQLCERFGVMPPGESATHFSARLGSFRLKWEKHGEFSGYTFFVTGLHTVAFSEPANGYLPKGWLSDIPGRTIVAAHAKLIASGAEPAGPAMLLEHFDGNVPVGAEIGDGAGYAYTDFRIHDDGCARFLVLDRSFTRRQAGRLLQRLFEIEVYRMMALLALPIARRQTPRISVIERSLATLTDHIAVEGGEDESLLNELTKLAAEVESALAACQYRFGASRAYYELVRNRIAELHESHVPGLQTIGEFMTVRLAPAVATCAMVSQRLLDLSERVSQACNLLSTRVDIASEKQNQALLASMERRARMQLKLQQTVEGLSIAAITYYAVGLVGYAVKAAKAAGFNIQTDIATGLSIPVVAILVAGGLRHVRNKIVAGEQHASYGL